MREFELIFDEALKFGLSPDQTVASNTQILFGCLGFRCGRSWLEGYDPLDNHLPDTIAMYYDWPFPQFLVGESVNILVIRNNIDQEDAVYQIGDDYATVTPIFDVDELTFGKGTLMEMADFGEYVFMTNGVIMIYYDPVLTAWIPTVALANIPMMRTVCNFKGQMIGGCVLSAWHDCDETSIVWSRIGELNFTPDRKNTAGYRRDPFGGEVYHVRRLGDSVVVYSSKGITLMSPVHTPAATFGFTELSDVGVVNRGAVGCGKDQHVYVDKEYHLHRITSNGDEDLGYYEYMDELEDGDVIITHDPVKKDFYIGNSTKTYLLSPYGLTEVPQHPSAMWRDVEHRDVYMIPEAIDDYEPLIESEVIDMGFRGEKTIFTIEAAALATMNPMVSAAWAKSFFPEVWGYTDYVPVNYEGVANLIISGVDFMIRLKFDNVFSGSRISYIKVRYKMTDMKSIRGIYAPPPRGQSYGS